MDGYAMRKLRLPIAGLAALLAATAAANDFKTSDIHWGEPSPITDHLGVAFAITSSTGAKGSFEFPAQIARSDGSLTYALQIEFQTDHFLFTIHCTYRDSDGDITADLRATLSAKGEPIGNGYVIAATQNKETEKAGKQCVTEITDGTYLLMKNNRALRLYVDPNNFFELSAASTKSTRP